MRPIALPLLLILILFSLACGSSSASSSVRADVEIVQTSGVPAAARHVDGAIPVRFAVRVTNRLDEAVTLRQISVQTLGVGAYTIAPTSSPFDVGIDPGQIRELELWAPAVIERVTIAGANGPVTVRATLLFEGPSGKFEEIVVRHINHPAGGAGGGFY